MVFLEILPSPNMGVFLELVTYIRMLVLIYTYVVNKTLHVIKVATVRITIFVANGLLNQVATRWLQTTYFTTGFF